MKWNNAFFLICIFLCATHSVKADEGREAMNRADSLFGLGQWFEASVEYERAFFLSSDASFRAGANLGKAASLKQMEAFDRASRDLRRSLGRGVSDSLRMEVMLDIAFCALMADRPGESSALLSQVMVDFPDTYPQQRVNFLEGVALVFLQDWQGVEEHVENLVVASTGDHLLGELRREEFTAQMDLAGMNKEWLEKKARMWSTFVPGAGQVYAGRPGWGVVNALSQLTALGAAALMGYHGLYIAGAVIGLGGFQSFYFGGITQAGEFALERAEKQKERLRAEAIAFLIRLDEDIYP